MLEINDARKRMLGALTPNRQQEYCALDKCLGRYLAEDIIASIDVPPADNSAMDGYAIHTDAINSYPATLSISQRITAGQPPLPLKAGTAARIYTGAEIPENCNAVVMQENCELIKENQDGVEKVLIQQAPQPKENIRPRGQDISKGAVILTKHTKLKPQDIGLLASIGIAKVAVYSPLKVAFVGTGDELVSAGNKLKAGQIFNSNQPMVVALLNEMGCHVVSNSWAKDTLEDTTQTLKEAGNIADIVITTGGVSVGDEDHVKNAVKSLGSIQLWKINIKPGKPMAFGSIGRATFLGLPGNPVSAFITFLLFAKPVITRLQGGIYKEITGFHLPAAFTINKPRKRPEFMRIKITEQGAEAYPNQSSGVLRSICWADALAFIPADTVITKGDLVNVLPLPML